MVIGISFMKVYGINGYVTYTNLTANGFLSHMVSGNQQTHFMNIMVKPFILVAANGIHRLMLLKKFMEVGI